jgi:hypothetical protein
MASCLLRNSIAGYCGTGSFLGAGIPASCAGMSLSSQKSLYGLHSEPYRPRGYHGRPVLSSLSRPRMLFASSRRNCEKIEGSISAWRAYPSKISVTLYDNWCSILRYVPSYQSDYPAAGPVLGPGPSTESRSDMRPINSGAGVNYGTSWRTLGCRRTGSRETGA